MNIFLALISIIALMLTVSPGTAQEIVSTNLPDNLQIITLDNADRIEELAVYGGGLVEDAEWSVDGSILAISGSVGVQLYEGTTFTSLGSLIGHTGDVSNISWASEGKRLASTGDDSTIRVWNVQNRTEELVIEVPESTRIRNIKWSHDNQMLAAVVYDDSCCVWITIWSVETGEEILRLDNANVGYISWSPLDSHLAYNSREGVIIFDVIKQQQLLTLEEAFNPFWSPDESIIAASIVPEQSAEDMPRSVLQLWNSVTGEPLHIVEGHDEIQGLAWSPDGTKIASAGWYNGVRVSNTGTNAEVYQYEGHAGVVSDVAWSPDGQYLVSVGDSTNFDNTVRVWDVATGEQVYIFEQSSEEIYAVSFSPDGSEIAVTGPGGSRVLDLYTGQPRLQLNRFGTDVDWSPIGSKIASAAGSGFPEIYDVESGNILQVMQESLPYYFWQSVVWSPDASKIAGGGDYGIIRVWDVSDGQELFTIEHSGWVTVDWSPDGTKLVSGAGSTEGDNTVRIWDAMTGEEIAAFTGHENDIEDVDWSPNSLQIATVSSDQTARILDSTTAEELQVFQGALSSIDWSLDGTMVVTGGADNSVIVWEVLSGRSIISLQGHTSPYTDVIWSPTNSLIVSASWDGTIRLWGVVE